MSRTYRDKIKQKYKRLGWDTLTRVESFCVMNYSKNPMWWNHMHSIKPKRHETTQLLHSLTLDDLEENDISWPSYKKPTVYYY
jgi:hypothetical protein